MALLKIGALAQKAQVSTTTIRYYESLGLIEPTLRPSNGYRYYAEENIQRLIFIKKAQSIGFSLQQIHSIFQIRQTGAFPCAMVKNFLDQRIAVIAQHMRLLEAQQQDLKTYQAQWREMLELSTIGTDPASAVICHYIDGVIPQRLQSDDDSDCVAR